MKLLIITQKVDHNDPVLGFFHGWIKEFSKHIEEIRVICLYEGVHTVPQNVSVFSLGKEQNQSRLQYLRRFYYYIWHERKNYDAVLVHMNQEYILLGGLVWKFLGKKIFMWRNHHSGSFLTDIAAFFCNKVFCTSRFSYTNKYRKTRLMPVGIDTTLFTPSSKARDDGTILSLGRISPVKNVHLLINACAVLKRRRVPYSACIYGDAALRDKKYYRELVESVERLGLQKHISFSPGVPNHMTPDIYQHYSLFVNMSSSGMYDKTIFEAMASGTLPLVSNKNLQGVLDDVFFLSDTSPEGVASAIEKIFALPKDARTLHRQQHRQYVIKHHSLSLLATRLHDEFLHAV